jgi:hypothetical protein
MMEERFPWSPFLPLQQQQHLKKRKRKKKHLFVQYQVHYLNKSIIAQKKEGHATTIVLQLDFFFCFQAFFKG